MVGRLIKNDEVRIGKHEFSERNSSFFATAQSADDLKYIFAGKKKGSKNISDAGISQLWIGIRNFIKNCFGIV